MKLSEFERMVLITQYKLLHNNNNNNNNNNYDKVISILEHGIESEYDLIKKEFGISTSSIPSISEQVYKQSLDILKMFHNLYLRFSNEIDGTNWEHLFIGFNTQTIDDNPMKNELLHETASQHLLKFGFSIVNQKKLKYEKSLHNYIYPERLEHYLKIMDNYNQYLKNTQDFQLNNLLFEDFDLWTK